MIYSSVDAAGVARVRHECKKMHKHPREREQCTVRGKHSYPAQRRLEICPLRHEILLGWLYPRRGKYVPGIL
jgi:hypothetical protein